MARIRHIALVALESEKVAEFYKTAFGMEEVHRHKGAETGDRYAIYLSDGYINLAILPIKDRPEGIYHFGFEVEDVDQAFDTALEAGAKPPYKTLPRDGRFAEKFVVDPVGIKVDLSRGWATSPVKKAEAVETVRS
ncbi:MAG TPA: VOC family protein [Candidatus Binatia bacterium]|nr:VOC family protein [Candidatus Binatia bacterium]